MRMDNGPEFISTALTEWVKEHLLHIDFIQSGKPAQNSFIEQFNGTYHTEVLDMYVFSDLDEVREISRNWIKEYNEERSHVGDRLGYDMHYAIDVSKIEKNFEWKAMHSFSIVIEETVKWYLTNLIWCRHVQNGSYQGERLGLIKEG
jgi:putative transposase